MESVKKINIKNRKYYFFYDMIKIKDFNPDLLKIDKKSYKNIDIYYYTGYITMQDLDYVKVNSLNTLHFIIDKVDGYMEEKNGNKYGNLFLVHEQRRRNKYNEKP